MAAGDFNKPANASVRTSFMQEIRDLVKDVARMLNPDTATSNIPVGAIRRNPTTKKFEEWNGTTWVDLPLTGQLVGNATIIKSAYTTGGSATAYTVTIPEVAALVSGDTYFVKAHIANTTTTPTLAVSGQAAKTIKKEGGVALVAGDIPINHEAVLRYNGTDMILLNPAKPTNVINATNSTNATNADTVDSYHAAGLLARSAHTGTQDGSTVVGGTLGSTVVPLARVIRTEVQGGGPGAFVDLSLGTVVTGDRILVTGASSSTSGSTAEIRMLQSAGTASTDIAGKTNGVWAPLTDFGDGTISGVFRVTSGGTLTIRIDQTGVSPVTYAHAIVLNNG